MYSPDYIIAGQGIAGTLLAFHLKNAGKKVAVFDPALPNASSVSAGIINPITGRKFVKSWMIEALLPQALHDYKALEQLLHTNLLQPQPLLRAFSNAQEENDWFSKSADPNYAPYIRQYPEINQIDQTLQSPLGYGEVQQALKIKVDVLLPAFRHHLTQNGEFFEEKIDYAQLIFENNKVKYQNLIADKIIFCEGSNHIHNPFFNPSLIIPNKGQLFIVHIPNATIDRIVKQSLFFVPLGSDRFWVGSTNERQFMDVKPTPEGYQFLYDKLKTLLKIPFHIEQHLTGLRATVKDRRPILGVHPDRPAIAFFNGMGTKGASLAPYWAKVLTQHLTTNSDIPAEVNLSRFF
jgi:glycine oxidase